MTWNKTKALCQTKVTVKSEVASWHKRVCGWKTQVLCNLCLSGSETHCIQQQSMNGPEYITSEQKISGLWIIRCQVVAKKGIRVMWLSLRQSVDSYAVVSNVKEWQRTPTSEHKRLSKVLHGESSFKYWWHLMTSAAFSYPGHYRTHNIQVRRIWT